MFSTAGPLVERGDTVLQGQLLINGVEEDEEGQILPGKANGVVRARVWEEMTGQKRISSPDFRLTDESRRSLRLRFGDREFNLYGPDSSPFSFYDRQERSWSYNPQVEGDWSELELKSVVYRKLERQHDTLEFRKALAMARAEAERELTRYLDGREAEIVEKSL